MSRDFPHEVTSHPNIRPMGASDLDAVRSIIDHWIAAGVATFDTEPWGPARADDWLRRATPRHVRLVAELGGVVAGWAATDRFRPKPAYEDALELSVYIAPEHLGAGLGRALSEAVISAVRAEGAHRLYAVVADHAPASTGLMSGLGMRHVGTLREVGRKHGRRVDVDLWELAL